MELSERILKLLGDLETSANRRKNAPHICAINVRDILENGEIHFAQSYPEYPGHPAHIATVVTPTGEVHTVQVHINPARGYYHHLCLMCDGYCDAAAAALIKELEGEPLKTTCPTCGR